MSKKHIIIAIDGPAASGKGTLARALAERLHCALLDTGALYRAVAFEVLQAGGNPENEEDALNGARSLTRKIAENDPSSPDYILHNAALKEDEMAQGASKVAAIQSVRDKLVDLQRNFAANPPQTGEVPYKGSVLDGRDIGTVICPEADIKFFVTADIEIRAQRRLKELQSKGIAVTSGTVLDDMRERDARDQGREAAPLKPADDAVILDTTHLPIREVLEKALEIVQEKASGPTTS